jgi:hypothetical protein
VKRGWKTSRPQDGNLTARLEEIEFPVEFEPVRHIEPFIEVQQVDTAAEQDVLAVVYDLDFSRRARERI